MTNKISILAIIHQIVKEAHFIHVVCGNAPPVFYNL